jgi:hypothetical protein
MQWRSIAPRTSGPSNLTPPLPPLAPPPPHNVYGSMEQHLLPLSKKLLLLAVIVGILENMKLYFKIYIFLIKIV